MGKWIDRFALTALGLGTAYVYFQLTLGIRWLAILLALLLCALVWFMRRDWLHRHGRAVIKFEWRKIQLANRKTAPRCALYGALYLALYLMLGQIVYLPLSLALLFLAGIGFRKKDAPQPEEPVCL